MERRLAAILAADLVGFTRLMGADEAGTVRRLAALRDTLIGPLVAEHRGRIIKQMGDGFLVEFASVVDAVACASAWQQGLAARNDAADLHFRIGVNLGDVIVEGDDLLGDGVNLAARLEALAEPGGICLSEDAHRQVRGKLDLAWESLGAQRLKGIAEPVVVFRLASDQPRPAAAAVDWGLGQPTLAVTPFRHLGDPAQSFLAEGLSETLCAALAHFEEFAFIGAPGAERPSFLLEGSVQTLGSRARIAVQLSEGATGRKVWGESFDRSLEDPFALQDEVVGIVASTLGEAILEEGARALADKQPHDYTAYDWTLDGVHHLHRVDPNELRVARSAFEHALAISPDLPLAAIGLGWTYITELINGWDCDRPDAYDYCVALAKSLLKNNERYDQAHRLLARLYHMAGRHDEAMIHSKRAYEINPHSSDMVVSYGLSLIYAGQAAEGLDFVERGCRINPYAPAYYRTYLALGYFLAGRLEDAVSALRRLERPIGSSRLFLAASLAELGQREAARDALDAHLADHPQMTRASLAASLPFKEARDREAYLSALGKAGLKNSRNKD